MPESALDITADLLELEGAERAAALRARCAHDPKLLAEVRSLLAIDESASGFLEPGSIDHAALLATDAPAPTAVGPYRIVRPLGEGGFGIVYLAEQDEPIRRQVALKVIKPGMDSSSVVRRFEGERQTLALLEHANIARVIEGGLIPEGQTGAGRPFFAMEYVEGEPITRYVIRHRLHIEARLGLVLQACAAVQHAHAKGVIHRDLKPSNILVSGPPNDPVCKIIDFGIAKALSRADAFDATVTRAGAVVGTPQYMSPEQARGSGDVDTRSDVYALGAVLYELLAGVPPIDAELLRTPDLRRLRSVIEGSDVKPPSSRIATRPSKAAGDTEHPERRADPRRVRGELDWITLRAMAREPERRYQTTAAFADDLRRFLRSEPVDAGPPSAAYRVSKFVRRNRAGVAAAGVASLAVIAGVIFSVWFGLAAERARAEEQSQREIAERNAARVVAINTFLTDDLFFAANPENLGSDAKLVELIEATAPRIDTRFADDPSMRVRLHTLMSSMFSQLFRFDDAMRHSETAVGIAEAELEPGDPAWADAYEARSSIAQLIGDIDLTESSIRRAIDLVALEEAPSPSRRMSFMGQLGMSLSSVNGKEAEADAALAEAIAFFSVSEDSVPAHLVKLLTHRIQLLWRTQRFEEATQLIQAIIEVADADDSRSASLSRVSGRFWLIQNLRRLDRLEDAAEAALELLPIALEMSGERSILYAAVLCTAGQLLTETGRYDEAVPILDRCMEVTEDVFGPYHYEVERAANFITAQHAKAGPDEVFRAWRTRGLLLRLYVAGAGEVESVEGIMGEGRAMLGSMDPWVDSVIAEMENTPPGHPRRSRYLANAARALHAVSWAGDAPGMLIDAHTSLAASSDPAGDLEIIRAALPAMLRDLAREDEAAEWEARLAPIPGE